MLDNQQQLNDELHQRTIEALQHASTSSAVTLDDLSLLCWHAGINIKEIVTDDRSIKTSHARLLERLEHLVADWPNRNWFIR